MVVLPKLTSELTHSSLNIFFGNIPRPVHFDENRDPEAVTGQYHVSRIDLSSLFDNKDVKAKFLTAVVGVYTTNPIVFKVWSVLVEQGLVTLPEGSKFSGDFIKGVASCDGDGPVFEGRISIRVSPFVLGLTPEMKVHEAANIAIHLIHKLVQGCKNVPLSVIERVIELSDRQKYVAHYEARGRAGFNLHN